jgi:hypothetical protein
MRLYHCSPAPLSLIRRTTDSGRHSVRTHADLNFTVVINPGSGPGPESLPDANYTREIPILAAFDNVRLLGYVATGYATRDTALVRRDIETYAAWPSLSAGTVAVNGIFFDETPQQFYSEALAYFQNLTALVKESKGFGGDNLVSICLFLL